MSRSTPSLLALLGLVAVAGYQNRGRISEMLADAKAEPAGPAGSDPASGGGFLGEVGQLFGSGSAGGTLSSGLGELVSRFRQAGRAPAAESWVSAKPNMPVDVRELESALGPDVLDDLAARTGLPRSQLLLRLNAALPEVVNRFTPEGRLPTQAEADRFL